LKGLIYNYLILTMYLYFSSNTRLKSANGLVMELFHALVPHLTDKETFHGVNRAARSDLVGHVVLST